MRRTCLGFNDRKLLRSASAIVGIDEVGRGCLAGPVVVGGVRFERIGREPRIQDSKTLTAPEREEAADWVLDHCCDWTILEVWVELIDRLNILEATRLAMCACARTLAIPGAVIVSDGLDFDGAGCLVESPVRADATYFSVAAASVVAKVHRDRLMVALDGVYPSWRWASNKGYGTVEHRQALAATGRSYLHRKTFRWTPVLP